MTCEEYAKQLKKLGEKAHYYKDVWWQEVKPFYYWPIDLFQAVRPQQTNPALYRALLGYEHMVPEKSMANTNLEMMCLENLKEYSLENLKEYSLENLPKKKRNQIRRGIENVKVRPITDKNFLIEQGYKINLSALKRQGRKTNTAKFYTSPLNWKKEINATFDLKDRTVWGAFRDKNLIAYLRTIKIEKTITLTNLMSHGDFLRFYPNEALIYNYILHQKNTDKNIERIHFGLCCSKESVNRFKEQMGFEKIEFPSFRKINPLIKPLLGFTKYKHYFNYDKRNK